VAAGFAKPGGPRAETAEFDGIEIRRLRPHDDRGAAALVVDLSADDLRVR
jgi:hypothetical protein